MKEKKLRNSLFKVFSSILVLAMVIIVSQTVSAKAAGKKVRVNTLDELVAAVDNSSVDTIVLCTEIHGKYTISAMDNAKNKNLIVDASYVDIVNKAVWKSIEIQSVGSFNESVSGNTFKIPTYNLDKFEVAKKKTVKKLIMVDYYGYEETDFYYTLRKGAKIKDISYIDYNEKEYKLDKDFMNLGFEDDAFEWCETAEVDINFDKNGRIINVKGMFETEPANEYVFKYDKNGNLIEATGYQYNEGKQSMVAHNTMEYDSKNRLTLYITENPYLVGQLKHEYKYNSKGRLIKKIYSSEAYNETIDYTYYKNGRLKKETFTEDYSVRTTTYKYNDLGFIIQEKYTDSNYPGVTALATFKYDKDWNNTKYNYKNFEGEVTKTTNTYDEYGKWVSSTIVYPDGTEYYYDQYTVG